MQSISNSISSVSSRLSCPGDDRRPTRNPTDEGWPTLDWSTSFQRLAFLWCYLARLYSWAQPAHRVTIKVWPTDTEMLKSHNKFYNNLHTFAVKPTRARGVQVAVAQPVWGATGHGGTVLSKAGKSPIRLEWYLHSPTGPANK